MIKFDFHVRKTARQKYQFETSLFSISGDLIIASFRQVRTLAGKINDMRKSEGKHDDLITAGQLNAVGLIHEILHFLIRYYEDNENPGVMARGISYMSSALGHDELEKIFVEYVKDFPPVDVLTGHLRTEDYINGYTGTKPNREIIFEELLLLHFENINSAAAKFEELFSDRQISQTSRYKEFLAGANTFFQDEKHFGTEGLPLLTFLKRPILSSPYSLEGQLEYIRQRWNVYIKEKFGDRILSGKDLMQEDMKLFIRFAGGKLTPPVPEYKVDEEYLRKIKLKLAAGEKLSEDESRYYNSEAEKFTRDIEWMPNVVMMAKNIFVWLDQLSKKYRREIKRLDQVPDEELDLLYRWNFTALWLIGVWERSSASRKIKQLTGNPEAASSAYSLFDYVISNDLGGEEAFQNLKARAWRRGIRLASDMVPNHTGIYSKWVIEKPGYFIQTDVPPYPSYSFNGPNLSDDARVEIRIEDKYYSREDAAVVFQRRDAATGDVRYIYHGNDGTNMPWNDTAQLDLVNAEVRESLIQTIIHVARKFPVIRFDAAMTLAKKHYQRLWFPKPGTGGAIPSRSDYAMTQAAFDKALPEEFWREVVDRINSEVPETLLLAEAFWLMEGYFVRTLGMHRVYNSAFMHMLMKEENNKYRELIKNTLDFNPEILKRYVNFMSNPDEETAVNQFGKGDKYFGVSVMMVTLPGLPMFGHGQVEGLSEKYGMEYKKAYYNESPDEYLVKRHEAEIFPLMLKRHLFSQVIDFEFYDFYDESGYVNENVFAYSNKSGSERALVVFNNSFGRVNGGINYSVNKLNGSGGNRVKKLSEALDLKNHHKIFYVCRNCINSLEYIIPGKQILDDGISFRLNGYEYKVLLDFREVYDETGDYEKLAAELNNNGVPSIDYALKEIKLKPFRNSLNDLFDKIMMHEFEEICSGKGEVHGLKGRKKKTGKGAVNFSPLALGRINNFIDQLRTQVHVSAGNEQIIGEIKNMFEYSKEYFELWDNLKSAPHTTAWLPQVEALSMLCNDGKQNNNLETFLIYGILKIVLDYTENLNNILFEKLLLGSTIFEILKSSGHHIDGIEGDVFLLKILISRKELPGEKFFLKEITPDVFVSNLLGRKDICDYIFLNEFEGVIYYNKERFGNLIRWLSTLSSIHFVKKLFEERHLKIEKSKKILSGARKDKTAFSEFIKEAGASAGELLKVSDSSNYKIKELKQMLSIAGEELIKPAKKKAKISSPKKKKNKKTK